MSEPLPSLTAPDTPAAVKAEMLGLRAALDMAIPQSGTHRAIC
jgi:hypothetical protein